MQFIYVWNGKVYLLSCQSKTNKYPVNTRRYGRFFRFSLFCLLEMCVPSVTNEFRWIMFVHKGTALIARGLRCEALKVRWLLILMRCARHSQKGLALVIDVGWNFLNSLHFINGNFFGVSLRTRSNWGALTGSRWPKFLVVPYRFKLRS